jgi:hypothetical protein
MTLFGLCRSDSDVIPSVDDWKLARSVGFSYGRIGPGLQNAFPASGREDFTRFDELFRNFRAAGLMTYFNPCNFPAHASGGQAVYVAAITGSSCEALKLFGAPPELWPAIYAFVAGLGINQHSDVDELAGAAMARFPTLSHAAAWHFAQSYINEFLGAWAWDDPPNATGGPHLWGHPSFVEQDKLSAPRPGVQNPPPVDPEFVSMAGRVLAERYGSDIDLWGMPLNEPDIALFYPPQALDWRDGVDNVRDRIYPQIVKPWIEGVRKGLGSRVPRFVCIETATAGMQQRCVEADTARDMQMLSGHWYAWGGEGWPKDSYRRIGEEYVPLARRDGRPLMCGEIDGPPVPASPQKDGDGSADVSIVDWTREVLAMNTGTWGITYNVAERFIDGFVSGKAEINRTGAAMKALIGPSRRRPSRHP